MSARVGLASPYGEQHVVLLDVPAMPHFLRIVRLIAATLASRTALRGVEDLLLKIDELYLGLTGPEGRPGTVRLRFLIRDNGLEVQVEVDQVRE